MPRRKQHTTGQDAKIKVERSKTSLKKDGETFGFYFVTEIGRGYIIGYEDEAGNDVHDKIRRLESLGWTY